MEIEEFQKSFKFFDVDLKPYITVVSILIGVILIIILLNNSLTDYYSIRTTVKNKRLEIITNTTDIDKITRNEKIMIEKDIFTYKIYAITDLIYNGITYKKIEVQIDEIDKNKLIDNDIIDVKIITNKTTIFKYLIKIMKGE